MKTRIWNKQGDMALIFTADLPLYERIGWTAEEPKPKRKTAKQESE